MKKSIRALAAATRADRVLLATAMLGLAVQLAFSNGRLLAGVLIIGIAATVLARQDMAARIAPLWEALPCGSRWVLLAPAVVLVATTPFPLRAALVLTAASTVLAVAFWFVAAAVAGREAES